MKFSGFIALTTLIGASVLAGSLSGEQNAAVAAEPRVVTELGYESIFDGWQEAPLAKVTINGRGPMPEVNPQAQRMYEQIAADLEQPPVEFVEASWSGYEFIELNDEIRKSYPDIYVTASRANPSVTSSRYDLVFTEYPPADLIEKVRDLPVDVDIRYGAPLPYAALDGVQNALSDRFSTEMLFVVEASPLGTSLRLKYSPRPGALDPETQGQRLLEAAREVTNALTVRGSKPPTLVVQRDDQLRLEENFAADYMGGWGYTGSIGCTSGFAATLNGVRGLLTADHCPNLPTYVPTG